MAGGRPRLIKTPADFDALADAYFAECKANERPVLVTGLALALGLSSRQALDVYADRPEFCDCVRRAKLRVEAAYEERLHGTTPTGAIFALKNMQWSDRQELAVSGGLEIVSQAQRDAAVKAAGG